MKIYAVTKGTDLYKRKRNKFYLLYEIPEDFRYLIFTNLEEALEEGLYNVINEEYSNIFDDDDEISKHIPRID